MKKKITVNETEKALIDRARTLARLQARRRDLLAQIDAIDVQIIDATEALGDVIPSTPLPAPVASEV